MSAPHQELPAVGPIRTCVGCRAKVSPAVLLRVVAVDGVLTPDPRHRLPGRGAWVHPDQGCLDVAERRRAFGRALRLTGPLDVELLRDLVTSGSTAGRDEGAPPGSGP